jgi:hypothetical protein
MTNREILRASPAVLSESDRQRQYVLRVHLVAPPCPACGRGLNCLEAAGIDIDDFDCDAVARHACVCPCGAELEQVVPAVTGGGRLWHWNVEDDWLRTQLEKARAYDRLPREVKQP